VIKHPSGNVLVLPVEGGHDEEGLTCWCAPTYFVNCDECENGDGCWKCDRGKVWITCAEAEAEDRVVVIVHNRVSPLGASVPETER